MPVYSSLETIKAGMESNDSTQWKVFDQDENLMNLFKGLASTTPSDSYMNLEKFLQEMDGDGYVIIKAYPKGMKLGAGGDTARVLKYNYRLKGSRQNGSSFNNNGGGISFEMYMQQLTENNRLQMELLTEKLTRKENKNTSYFESVAEKMGIGFAKEYMKKEHGITGDDDEDEDEKPKKKKTEPVNGTKETKPADKEKIKSAFKRTGDATVEIMRIAKAYGSDYDTVAESFEEMAELAKNDPMKLKALFDKLKKK